MHARYSGLHNVFGQVTVVIQTQIQAVVDMRGNNHVLPPYLICLEVADFQMVESSRTRGVPELAFLCNELSRS